MKKEEGKQLIVVIGALKDDKGRILLQKRRDPTTPLAHEKWELPGGKIEFGESAEDALCREIREEIGCKAVPLRVLPSVKSKLWNGVDGKINHVLVLCFEARLISGTPQPMDKKVSEVRWCTKKEIESMDVLINVKEFVNML